MNKTILFVALLVISFSSYAQNKIPSVLVKTVSGETVNTNTFANNGSPMVISFWATWCKPCVQELTAIADLYEDWQKETSVKLVAVSIDDARNSARVLPFINARAWEYDVYLDPNSDFKRAMNVGDIPHTFLVNSKGEIVWQHVSYAPGDETELFEKIKTLAKGETISKE